MAASSAEPDTSRQRERPRAGKQILALGVLTVLIAELAWGSTPLVYAWALVPMTAPLYVGGALLIREIARRRGLGWGAILLLGLAYGLIEEGIALQSLTSTTMYPVADWAPRVLGVNTGYLLSVVPYHAVFSAALPILAVELLFPHHRRRPYLRRRGLVGTAVVFVVGVAIMRAFAAFSDPGYQVPPLQLAAIVIAVALLVAVALRRPGPASPAGDAGPPRPAWVAAFAAVVVLLFLGLLMPLNGGGSLSSALPGLAQWLPLVVAPAIAAAAAWPLRRWARHADWCDPHSAALLGGALVAHTVIGLLVFQGFGSVVSVAGLVLLAVAEAAFAVWLVRRAPVREALHQRS